MRSISSHGKDCSTKNSACFRSFTNGSLQSVSPIAFQSNASISSILSKKRVAARIPVLIAQIFDKWPSRKFLQTVGRIAGLDSGRLLRILEEMVRCGMRYDPDFTVPFLDVLEQHLR